MKRAPVLPGTVEIRTDLARLALDACAAVCLSLPPGVERERYRGGFDQLAAVLVAHERDTLDAMYRLTDTEADDAE